jgi:predicted GNAT family acetyltransferase
MELKTLKNMDLSRFDIFVDGELAGFAEFTMKSQTMVFPHTEVDPKFGGKGVGGTLVTFALDDAKASGFNVAPFCPFVAKTIMKNPEKYLQLVPEDQRAKFKLV